MIPSTIIKKEKKKSNLLGMEDSKSMMLGKENMNHAIKSLAPDMEEGEDEEKSKKKGMAPEIKFEIDFMLKNATAKKK